MVAMLPNSMEDLRKLPDYETGYADGLNDRNPTDKGTIAYEAGWAAGRRARQVFQKAGFTQDGEDSFSLSLKL
jgi:hypothetical protein